MKTIGMIGGMSWESTVTYYQIINQTIKEKLGGFHCARCILYNVDFHDIEECMRAGDWARGTAILSKAAQSLEKAGADFFIICTNTWHKVAEEVQAAVTIPLLHIADLTAAELIKDNLKTVAFLGTKYTMEHDFYRSKLAEKGITALIPDQAERECVNDIIFQELCLGKCKAASRTYFLTVLARLHEKGAQAAILGCTEIGLLIKQEDAPYPLFDTAVIHAHGAALHALE